MTLVARDHYGPSIDSLSKLPPRSDGVRFWWLGQAGFAIEAEGARILIDPYMSDSLAQKYRGKLFPHERLHPSPIEATRLVGIDAVLHSHAHTDHLDPQTISALLGKNDPVFIAPRAITPIALERGIPAGRLAGMTAGETVRLSDTITVEALPSAHEQLEQDDAGDFRCLGYVLTIGGVRIYHSGDCVPFAGQVDLLRDAAIDVALLPINGRDEYRTSNGVPGNFLLSEAVDLARSAGIPSLVGHHFGLFDFNTIDPELALDYLSTRANDLEWTLPSVGLTYRLNPTGVSGLGTLTLAGGSRG